MPASDSEKENALRQLQLKRSIRDQDLSALSGWNANR